LVQEDFPPPGDNETEPQYTARVLLPKVERLVSDRVSDPSLWVKGDGANSRAYALTFMGFAFHPDIAIGDKSGNYWCAEVKLSRSGFSGDVIAKALGQSLIYNHVFPQVLFIKVMHEAGAKRSVSVATRTMEWLSVLEISFE
jgi:hypothetical protein